jgi:hypothetical protein
VACPALEHRIDPLESTLSQNKPWVRCLKGSH